MSKPLVPKSYASLGRVKADGDIEASHEYQRFFEDVARKLFGVSAGATVNADDAVLLDRANHTGQQDADTIDGLASVAITGDPDDLVGNFPISKFAGGIGASALTFWRGDQVWATPPSGGGGATVDDAIAAAVLL